MPTQRITQISGLFIAIIFASFLYNCSNRQPDPFQAVYETNCSSCHANNLQGTPLGPALVGTKLKNGETVDEIAKSIREGSHIKGMPTFSQTLSEVQIKGIAILISEQRLGHTMDDFKFKAPMEIPKGIIESERHAFRLEIVATDLHQWPYSIAPLPDGRILLTEKTQGLSIISKDGQQSNLIQGTPRVYDDGYFYEPGPLNGTGWMLDVAIHPDYEDNGWIYLSFGDRCSRCNTISRQINQDVSMTRLVRGRIKGGVWTDQQTIWEAEKKTYTPVPETATGGRICFDNKGHVFLSVGAKSYSPHPPGNIEAYLGIQNLSLPYGKIYRVYDDGRIPEDNPFVDAPGALTSIWTYGHRSPQGLEVEPSSGLLWGTEMGPRGGDEVNLLLPGKNYGWPLYSKGVNYDGSAVAFGKYLGITFDLADIEQPVVDMTPAPAVSSFVFYDGDVFPEWKGNLIAGTLKAAELYRMELKGTEVVHGEILLDDLARIRDIEVGYDGNIYLLLEHKSGGQIVRLVSAKGKV